jgi:cytochrome c oxidase subunit 2
MLGTTTEAVDSAFIVIMALSFLLFALIIFFTVYFAVRYRRSRNPVPTDSAGSTKLELVWIGASVLLALALFFYGLTGFKFLRTAPPGSLAVHVTARQWSWLFTYENGRKSADLVVPQGRDISLTLESTDVIHGFFVPAYRIKTDVVPGMKTYAWFKASDLGSFDVLCTQYCGLQHSQMLAVIWVVAPGQYTKWVNGEDVDIPGLTSQSGLPEGQKLLSDNGCLACHSLDGTELVGPTFKGLFGSRVRVSTGRERQTVTADAVYLADSIVNPGHDLVDGYEDIMPSGSMLLTDAQVHEITEFIATLK